MAKIVIKRKDIINYFGAELLKQKKAISKYSNKQLRRIFVSNVRFDIDYFIQSVEVKK